MQEVFEAIAPLGITSKDIALVMEQLESEPETVMDSLRKGIERSQRAGFSNTKVSQ